MAKLNMANMNTLFKKVYLLAGVMMAANMFVVNEVRATNSEQINPNMMPTGNDNSNTNTNNKENPFEKGTIDTGEGKTGDSKTQFVQNITNKVLSHENIINLFGGLAFSCVNNYFKWWDYNPGTYCKFVWFGWRSKRFLNDMFQFELNLNLVRGISWSILHIINFIMMKNLKKGKKSVVPSLVGFFLKDILQGFTSIPLTFHISNFSIVISLDSIILGIIGVSLDKKDNKGIPLVFKTGGPNENQNNGEKIDNKNESGESGQSDQIN